jgi:hypothetical protein
MGEADDVDLDLNRISTDKISIIGRAHGSSLLVLEAKYDHLVDTFSEGIDYIYEDLFKALVHLMHVYRSLRMSVSFDTILENPDSGDLRTRIYYSPSIIYSDRSMIFSRLQNVTDYLTAGLQYNSNQEGSGWTLHSIVRCEMKIAEYEPIRAQGYIPFPSTLTKAKRYCWNIKTRDSTCFSLSVMASLFHNRIRQEHFPNRDYCDLTRTQRDKFHRVMEDPDSYIFLLTDLERENLIDLDGFIISPSLDEIDNFEETNDCSVLVIGYEKGSFYPIRPTQKLRSRHVDLLLLRREISSTSDEIEYEYHYVAIRNLKGLLGVNKNCSTICRLCLKAVTIDLSRHLEKCAVLGNKRIKFPKSKYFEFKRDFCRMPIAYKIYFKISTYFERIDNVNPFKEKLTYTKTEGNFLASAYCIVVVSPLQTIDDIIYYDGPNVMESFLATIFNLQGKYTQRVQNNAIPLTITDSMKDEHCNSVVCPHCQLPFDQKGRKQTYHHSHVVPVEDVDETNCYLGNRVICASCNLKFRQKAVVFIGHNTSRCESHLILKSLNNQLVKQAKLVCKGKEKIVSLIVNKCRFVDLNNFLNSSLSDLVYRHLDSSFVKGKASGFHLLHRGTKGIRNSHLLLEPFSLPDKWMNSGECFNSTSLPPKHFFYDVYAGEEVSDQVYEHSQTVFREMRCETFRDYLKLYLTTQVLLLCDIGVQFETYMQREFSMCIWHSNTIHSYNFDCFTSSLKEPWENIRSVDVLQFVTRAVTGGLVTSNIRLCESNNEYCGNFNGNPSSRIHLMNVDCVAAYGSAALLPLGYRNYRFMSDTEVAGFDLSTALLESEKGYLLEVSVSTPKHLHDEFKSMPITFCKRKIHLRELSEFQETLFHTIHQGVTDSETNEVLVLDLTPKTNIVVHSGMLNYWLSRGIQLQQIHRVLEFDQVRFVSDYMSLLLGLRKTAALDGDLIFFQVLKVMANGLVGRLQCSSLHQSDFKVSLTKGQSKKLIQNGSFENYIMLNSDVVLFQMSKRTINYSGALIAAACILSHSKIELFKMYHLFQQNFESAEIVNMDTDGFIIKITDPENNIWNFFRDNKHRFDLSRINDKYPAYSVRNQHSFGGIWRVVEMGIISVVSLRNKAYSVLSLCKVCGNQKDFACTFCVSNKCSGVKKAVLKRLSHQYYLSVLRDEGVRYIEQDGMISRDHELSFVKTRKIGFHGLNVSRYLMPDKVNTLPHGFGQ